MRSLIRHFPAVVVLLALGTGLLCTVGCSGNPFRPVVVQTPEEFCAALPYAADTGHLFYCGTSQGNLGAFTFPDGSHGLCLPTQSRSIGLVGYLAYTFGGLVGTVESQSTASAQCNAFNVASNRSCPGYITCSRQ
jgi:hypothetical protein